MTDNISIKDALGNANPVKTTWSEADQVHTPHHIIDSMPDIEVTGFLTDAELRASPVPVGVESLPTIAKCSFGRLRTSNPGYRFDSQFTYGIDSDLWDQSVSGGTPGTITHSATERWAAMTAPASGATAVLQSHYHAPYTPGRGQLAFITFLLGSTPGTGGVRKVGYWDGTNGIYLEQSASAVNLVLASGTSKPDETVPQASWNIDTLGAGVLNPSGLTLDLTKMQILVIQAQALYVGQVTVGFDIGGNIVPVHSFACANEEAFPYIQQASLPVRYEVATSSASTTMYAVCASVISEGGNDLQNMAGRQFAAYGKLTNVGSVLPAIVIRQSQTLNSINQNSVALPTDIDVAVADAGVWVEVWRNATITGGTFESVNATQSTMEMCWAGNSGTDPAVTAATGTLIDKFYVAASNTTKASRTGGLLGKTLLAYSHLLGAGDNLVVTIDPDGGSTADVFASLKWKEIR